MEATALFTPGRIGTLEIKNRILMAPLLTNQADADGFVTDVLIEYYRQRAAGGTGMIIQEQSACTQRWPCSSRVIAFWDDKYIPRLRELTDAVHEAGAKICVQLGDMIRLEKMKPSDLTLEQVHFIRDSFIRAAERAAEAGYDAVEIHGAHSYTLSDFLSIRGNDRTDEYGRTREGRLRIVAEILAGIRKSLGREYPVQVRINGDEYIVRGNSLEQSRWISKRLEQLGADAIHVTAGGRLEDGGRGSYSDLRNKPTEEMPYGCNVYLAQDIKKHVKIPVIAVGKLGKPEVAEETIASGKADFVALARQLLADPEWVRKIQEGSSDDIDRCICCNECTKTCRVVPYKGPVYCNVYK